MRRALLIGLAPALLLGACGSGTTMGTTPGTDALPTFTSAMPMTLTAPAWNANDADLGKIAALTELEDDVIVYSDKGAFVMSGGAVSAQDPSVTSWQAAGTIAGADGTGDWAIGVDGKGALWHLRARATVEDVTDRYGLVKDPVATITRLDGLSAAFGLASQLAVSDGAHVTRFDEKLSAMAGGGGRIAGVAADGSVHVVDPRSMMRTIYPLTDAVGVAFGLDNKAVIAGQHALYHESAGALTLLFKDDNTTFRGVTASGGWIWIAAGSELYGLANNQLFKTSGLGMDRAATLVSSTSGDAWALGGGKLARYSAPAANADESAWRMNILPVYARSCSSCHAPGGTSGFPLATYQQWVDLRALIYMRVIVKGDMPQGRTLADADKTAIATWSMMK